MAKALRRSRSRSQMRRVVRSRRRSQVKSRSQRRRVNRSRSQKRMNKKNKIYKKSKKINKYFNRGGSSDRQRTQYGGVNWGEIGKKTERELLDYLRERGGSYTGDGIQLHDMLHLFRLIQVVEDRLGIKPALVYNSCLEVNPAETVNMNRYTNDAWPVIQHDADADADADPDALSKEYIDALVMWMDTAADFERDLDGSRTWMEIIDKAGSFIQGFGIEGVDALTEMERPPRQLDDFRDLGPTYSNFSDSWTPYFTFRVEEGRDDFSDTEKNNLAKLRMQEGLLTLQRNNVIRLIETRTLTAAALAVGAFGDSGEHRQLRDSLRPVVDEFLLPYDGDALLIIYQLIGDKVAAGAGAGLLAGRVSHAATPALPGESFVVDPPPFVPPPK